MPELPEVQTIVSDLSKSLFNKTFSDVIVHDALVLLGPKRKFIQQLAGQTIKKIIRRGKAVVIHLGSREILVVQLMMTGQLIFNADSNRHTRVTFTFLDGGKLLYNDQRRFGRLQIVKNLNEIKYFNILGPEPFSKEFNSLYVQKYFKKSARPIKSLLLDHTFVAGIGNIYACEILFRSGISPKRLTCQISAQEADVIYHQIIDVLEEAIKHRGSSVRNYRDGTGQKGNFNQRLAVYGREGLDCLKCHALIERIAQSSRSTFYCARCQK
ncbi:MAG: bifunctional DNA-formamidopyrimidine glycosylase/DNA-(apurinic or apyrimidinic site) lyase [Candidatus Omnitrophica bacterium]|nr:bifunctional DNA-formamidopyrimidine glycosylase/DNA-(apurinic or apyrimidinic site) lyase [Candidatus Omnitrophota bacterium]